MRKLSALTLGIALMIFSSCCSTKNVAPEVATKETKEITQEKPKEMTQVLFKTSMGDITIALYNETPLHRDNFVKLVNDKFYDGVLFHRIIQNFMIQGGDPDSKGAAKGKALGMGGPGYTIPAEFNSNLIHKRGALAAARLGGPSNPKKESSGSQFYIVDGNTYSAQDLEMFAQRMGRTFSPEQIEVYTTIGGVPHLDGDYTVFGEVLNGMDIVDSIAAVAKDQRDRPLEDVQIIEATVLPSKE